MDRAKTLSPPELWKFAEVVTSFGKALHELNIENVSFQGQKYLSLQRFIHNQIFRCWYDPDIDFDLSV